MIPTGVLVAMLFVLVILVIYLTSRCPCGCSCWGFGCAFDSSCCVGCKKYDAPHCDGADVTMEFSRVILDPLPGVAVTVDYNKHNEWRPGHPVRGTCGKVVSRPKLTVFSEPIYTSYGEGDSIVVMHSDEPSDSAADISTRSADMESFTDKLNNVRRIYFHSTNWCPHCKTMKPIWEQVKLAAAESNTEFYEIDEDVAKTPGVNGIPTIRMLDEYGLRHQYPGMPDFEELRRWVMSPTVPVTTNT